MSLHLTFSSFNSIVIPLNMIDWLGRCIVIQAVVHWFFSFKVNSFWQRLFIPSQTKYINLINMLSLFCWHYLHSEKRFQSNYSEFEPQIILQTANWKAKMIVAKKIETKIIVKKKIVWIMIVWLSCITCCDQIAAANVWTRLGQKI